MKATIIQNISNQYKVVDEEDNIKICMARGKLKQGEITPVAGDKVEIENDAIFNILPRKNYIKRPKIANIDQIVFVVSMKDPKPDILLLDKQLAFAENLGVKSVIALNKCDLADSKEIKKLYEQVGYTVIELQAKNGVGIEELKKYLKDKITVFSGNSGVGKSTLINSLFNKNITEEGLISEKNKKGKNTTTAVTLYELEKNTYIADTPGFASFDINEIEYTNLDKEFIEFINYISDCKYVGCSHIYEDIKECGVKLALEKKHITSSRYNNYVKIYEELKEKYQRRYE